MQMYKKVKNTLYK